MYKTVPVFLLFLPLMIAGCTENKTDGENPESTSESAEKELEKPGEEEISKAVKLFFKENGKNLEIDGCNAPSDRCGEKKATSVRVLKLTDEKRGNPARSGEEKKTYWAAEVEITGECEGRSVVSGTSMECASWEGFETQGRYNIYQNDFGEWRAYWRGWF